jgi:hypothetical protein
MSRNPFHPGQYTRSNPEVRLSSSRCLVPKYVRSNPAVRTNPYKWYCVDINQRLFGWFDIPAKKDRRDDWDPPTIHTPSIGWVRITGMGANAHAYLYLPERPTSWKSLILSETPIHPYTGQSSGYMYTNDPLTIWATHFVESPMQQLTNLLKN